ncbi:hypothetical protein D3C72_1743420 [compost metagenome]
MNSVTPMPRQWDFTWPSAPKSIFSSIGIIMIQMRMPTGRFTWAYSMLPIAWNAPGIACPSAIPTTMHRATQMVR